MKTSNYDTTHVDVLTMACAGGKGSAEGVARQFIHAVEQYNERHGASLILEIWG